MFPFSIVCITLFVYQYHPSDGRLLQKLFINFICFLLAVGCTELNHPLHMNPSSFVLQFIQSLWVTLISPIVLQTQLNYGGSPLKSLICQLILLMGCTRYVVLEAPFFAKDMLFTCNWYSFGSWPSSFIIYLALFYCHDLHFHLRLVILWYHQIHCIYLYIYIYIWTVYIWLLKRLCAQIITVIRCSESLRSGSSLLEQIFLYHQMMMIRSAIVKHITTSDGNKNFWSQLHVKVCCQQIDGRLCLLQCWWWLLNCPPKGK